MDTLSSFLKKINIDKDYIEDILNIDVSKLDSFDDRDISKYCVALAQFLVYFKFTYNGYRADLKNKERILENIITMSMTTDIIKKYKTKKDAVSFLISTNAELSALNEEIDQLNTSIILLDGIDSRILEMVNTFKKELSRRENEYSFNRIKERG